MMTSTTIAPAPKPDRIAIGEKVKITRRGRKGIFQADFHCEGRHCRLSLKTRNEKEARRRAIQLEAQLLDGQMPGRRAKSKPILEAIEEYIAAKKIEDRSAATLEKYDRELRFFARFAAEHDVTSLKGISLALHDKYQAHRAQTIVPRTLHNNLVTLHSFLTWCRSRKWILENPLDGCSLRKPPRQQQPAPKLEEAQRLLAVAPEPYKTILLTLLLTGLRSGELAHLRPEDLDLAGKWIHVRCREDWKSKSRRSRQIPIHPHLLPYLAALPPHKRPYLFWNPPTPCYPNGREQLNRQHLNELAQRLAESVGIRTGRQNAAFCIHSLRHFFETHCVHARIPQPVINMWMGHGDGSMAAVYYQLHDEESQQFMQRLPFEEKLAASPMTEDKEFKDEQEETNV